MAPSLYKNRKIILLHINLLADIKQCAPSFLKPFLWRLTVLCAPNDLLMDTAAHWRSALTPPFPRGAGSHWAVSSSSSSPWTLSRRRLHHLPGFPRYHHLQLHLASPLLRALRLHSTREAQHHVGEREFPPQTQTCTVWPVLLFHSRVEGRSMFT